MLFPGGSGRVVLTDPHDLLNTGIEMEARPSGKTVRRLSLLSGGERSLTALAYLFAVFRARPSPFYLMDEVEAALDDVNLHRFLDLVHEFRDEAQLLVVSHQKRTMEAADVLYGVSMPPGGSSRVVSQRIRELEFDEALTTSLTASIAGSMIARHRCSLAVPAQSSASPSSSACCARVVAPRPAPIAIEAATAARPGPPPVIEARGRTRAAGRGRRPDLVRSPRPRSSKSSRSRGCVTGSGRTRAAFSRRVHRMRGGKIDDETWDDLEEALILADVGLPTTAAHPRRRCRPRAKRRASTEADALVGLVRDEVVEILDDGAGSQLCTRAGRAERVDVRRRERRREDDHDRQARGRSRWARAAGWCSRRPTRSAPRPPISSDCGPSAPAASSCAARTAPIPGSVRVRRDGAPRRAGSADLVLVDTAGRLHTKSNLMEELKKLRRIVDRTEGACKEVLLVIDAIDRAERVWCRRSSSPTRST